MKAATSQFDAHLAAGLKTKATCWRITRVDGVQRRYTDHDRALAVPGDGTYKPALAFERNDIQKDALFTFDSTDARGVVLDSEMAGEDLRNGLYNYAKIEMFIVNHEDLSMGKLQISTGRLGEITLKDTGFEAEFFGLMRYFGRKILRVYTPHCRVDLGGTECAVNLAPLTQTGTVQTVTDMRTFVAQAGLTGATGWFDHGLIKVLTGANTGLKREVKTWNAGTRVFKCYLTFPFSFVAGDTFTVYPGCDKSVANCRDKFNNILNYRGEPYVPGMDDVMRVPDAR